MRTVADMETGREARREAVRVGAGQDWGDPAAEAVADDADLAAAEAEARSAG